MLHLPANSSGFLMDPRLKPIATVESGTELLVDTSDNQAGRIRSENDFGSSGLDDVNPVTGPIGIMSVAPGDIVRIDILGIEVAEHGHIQLLQGYGALAGKVEAPKTKIVRISDDKIFFNDHIVLPVRPMVGTIGVAPSKAHSTLIAGVYGGNMDNRHIGPASTLYIKAQVPLGLVYLGDLHASMGDAEVSLTGVEVAGTVRLRLGVERGLRLRYPLLETPSNWEVIVYNDDIETAIEIACEDMALFLQSKLKVSLEEAVMLISAVCDVGICQAAPNSASGVCVRISVEKSVVEMQTG